MAGFNDIIQSSKQAKTSGKKSSIPILEDVPEDIVQASIDFLEKTKQKKELEADLASIHSDISEYVQKIQDERAFKGEFNNSYKIPAGDQHLMVTTRNVFKINSEDEDKLRKIFGEKFSDFIKEKIEVVLKDEVFKNEALQNELMNLLGDSFSKFFNAFTTLKVQEDYDENIYAFVKTPKKLADVRVFIEPTKSTIK